MVASRAAIAWNRRGRNGACPRCRRQIASRGFHEALRRSIRGSSAAATAVPSLMAGALDQEYAEKQMRAERWRPERRGAVIPGGNAAKWAANGRGGDRQQLAKVESQFAALRRGRFGSDECAACTVTTVGVPPVLVMKRGAVRMTTARCCRIRVTMRVGRAAAGSAGLGVSVLAGADDARVVVMQAAPECHVDQQDGDRDLRHGKAQIPLQAQQGLPTK